MAIMFKSLSVLRSVPRAVMSSFELKLPTEAAIMAVMFKSLFAVICLPLNTHGNDATTTEVFQGLL